MKDFRGLKIGQKAQAITLPICKATASFPKRQLYGRVSQIRRASASICANLAEGCGRKGKLEFAGFLQKSQGVSQRGGMSPLARTRPGFSGSVRLRAVEHAGNGDKESAVFVISEHQG